VIHYFGPREPLGYSAPQPAADAVQQADGEEGSAGPPQPGTAGSRWLLLQLEAAAERMGSLLGPQVMHFR
jgi:hypothetical protein